MNILIAHYLDLLLPFCLLLPFVAAIIPFLFSYSCFLRDLFSFIISILLVINVIILINFYINNGALSYEMGNLMGMKIKFIIEPISLLFALMISVLWSLNTLYSAGYVRAQDNQDQGINKDLKPTFFFACIALSIGFAIGIAFSNNLLTMFICYEMLTISTYPLISGSGTAHARKAGKKYLYILLGSSVIFFLPAIIIISYFTGSVDFEQGGIIAGKLDNLSIAILFFCFVFGSAKAAIMPLHSWLPTAMVAPVPVSALLHAVAVVKSGVFVIIKIIVYVFGLQVLANISYDNWFIKEWFTIVCCITILFASIIALKQTSIKKLLAYSTISQLSYMLLATSIMTPKGIIAAIIHMIFHGVSKITLFFVAGSIYIHTKKTEIKELDGIAKLMPKSMFAFTIAALSMIGIPPTACFYSKYYIFTSAWGNSNALIVIATLIVSTVLSASYFLPIIYRAYFNIYDKNTKIYVESSRLIVWPLIITGISILLILPFSGLIIDFIEKVVF